MEDGNNAPPQEGGGAGARIVLDIDALGRILMSSQYKGGADASYGPMPDARLLGFAIPQALAELRQQLALGRRLTVEESAEIADGLRQSLSGSTTTV